LLSLSGYGNNKMFLAYMSAEYSCEKLIGKVCHNVQNRRMASHNFGGKRTVGAKIQTYGAAAYVTIHIVK